MKELSQVFKAVISAMIGIGQKEDLAKDFERTEEQGPWPYIVVGLVMTAVFIAVVVTAVKFAIAA